MNTSVFTCNACNYSTDNKSNFSKHNRSNKHLRMLETGDAKQSHKCDFCDYETNKKSNFNRHVTLKHGIAVGKSPYKFECVACNQKILTNNDLQHHLCKKQHIQNVINNYPDTLHRCSSAIINRPDLSKKDVYIKTLNNGKKQKKQKKVEEPEPEPEMGVRELTMLKRALKSVLAKLMKQIKEQKEGKVRDELISNFKEKKEEYDECKEKLAAQPK